MHVQSLLHMAQASRQPLRWRCWLAPHPYRQPCCWSKGRCFSAEQSNMEIVPLTAGTETIWKPR